MPTTADHPAERPLDPPGSDGLDPVTRLVLGEAATLGRPPADPGRTLVVQDVDGALSRAVLDPGRQHPSEQHPSEQRASGQGLRAWVDDLRDARAAGAAGAVVVDPGDPLRPAPRLVLGRLPTSLSALDDLAERLARISDPDTRVVLGGRVKHMTRAQNDVLARHFSEVSASLGQQKCRVLHAAGPRHVDPPRWPRTHVLDDPVLGEPLTLVGRGTVFAEGRLDAGTRLLLQAMDREGPTAGAALDLGSGSGVIALWLARRGLTVRANDVSQDAVESTRLSAAAAGVEVEVSQADGLAAVLPGSVEVLASNPPFHRSAAKDSTPTLEMIDGAAAVLAEGGELWLVWNSHLPYLPRLRQRVGPTQVVARDRRYVVTRSTRR